MDENNLSERLDKIEALLNRIASHIGVAQNVESDQDWMPVVNERHCGGLYWEAGSLELKG